MARASLEGQQLLSQILNSMGFLRLLLSMEETFDIVIDDEGFYDAAPLTIDDLVNFLYEVQLEKVAAAGVASVRV